MGLDVYAGPLTRYYSGTWQTILQQSAAETGMTIEVVYSHGQPKWPRPKRARKLVLSLRDSLNRHLAAHLTRPLDWPEDPEGRYFTDKPAWDCYGSLLLWAAHNEHPNLPHPERALQDWTKDPAFAASMSPDFHTSYPSLLLNVEFWIPGDADFTFRAPDPFGNETTFGFTAPLLRELEVLNANTWGASGGTISAWRHRGAEHLAPFEISAQFGFAVLYQVARDAVSACLPVRLDY